MLEGAMKTKCGWVMNDHPTDEALASFKTDTVIRCKVVLHAPVNSFQLTIYCF